MYSPHPICTPVIIHDGDMSSDIKSDEVECKKARGGAIQVSWQGNAPKGLLIVNTSNDGKIFGKLSDIEPIEIKGKNVGAVCINLSYVGYNYIRLNYMHSDGSGKLTATLNLKE